MKVLMTSSEAAPYAKSGGLADVVPALSQELSAMGHDVRVLLPCYQGIQFISPRTLPGTCRASWGIAEVHSFEIIRDTLKDVPYYFISHPMFTQRPGIYGDTSFAPYPDSSRRTALYQHGVFEFCRHIDWMPDIIHCHDWTTGLIPYLLKTRYAEQFSRTASMLTIHNLGYQGKYPRLDMHTFGISPELASEHGDINLLRTGISYAHWVTTVSPTYAREIMTPEFGHGLEHLLQNRRKTFSGILNGVDYTEWNPETDEYIPKRYSIEDMSGKDSDKQELQGLAELEIRDDLPLIAMISRIAEQKGFVELLSGTTSALEEILRQLPVQLLIIGTGDSELEESLKELAGKHEHLSVMITFQDRLAHLAEAGADFFLMPSRYEPCGLNQIYSLKYGTPPIVRKTGGLADTVSDISEDQGTGIVFEQLTSESIFEAVRRAVYFWHEQKDAFQEVQKRGMKKDFSWKVSAQEYERVYTETRRLL